MKKGFVVLIVLGFICTGLWAQNTIVYDTVVPTVKYRYSLGFRYNFGFYNFHFQKRDWVYNTPGNNPWEPQNQWNWNQSDVFYFGRYNRNAPSLFYQAEWKFFIFNIAPTLNFMRIKDREPNGRESDDFLNGGASYNSSGPGPGYNQNNNKHEYIANDITWVVFGCDFQFLFKVPIVDRKIKYSLFAGPEFSFNKDFGINFMAGMDLGYKLTNNHILFAGFSVGSTMVNVSQGEGFTPAQVSKKIENNYDNIRELGYGPHLNFQFSVGLKTEVLGSAYYFEGKKAGKR